ncbi:uncharacterized protein M6B38_308635 [Iris pallida]|nr:uncharacterized protein M6B38_308635 [Iris pallida]
MSARWLSASLRWRRRGGRDGAHQVGARGEGRPACDGGRARDALWIQRRSRRSSPETSGDRLSSGQRDLAASGERSLREQHRSGGCSYRQGALERWIGKQRPDLAKRMQGKTDEHEGEVPSETAELTARAVVAVIAELVGALRR